VRIPHARHTLCCLDLFSLFGTVTEATPPHGGDVGQNFAGAWRAPMRPGRARPPFLVHPRTNLYIPTETLVHRYDAARPQAHDDHRRHATTYGRATTATLQHDDTQVSAITNPISSRSSRTRRREREGLTTQTRNEFCVIVLCSVEGVGTCWVGRVPERRLQRTEESRGPSPSRGSNRYPCTKSYRTRRSGACLSDPNAADTSRMMVAICARIQRRVSHHDGALLVTTMVQLVTTMVHC